MVHVAWAATVANVRLQLAVVPQSHESWTTII